MSFLTPLYLLGALAVSLPILFHMIRRTPRDRREFSSTMFLQPSPPKITRRSRIEHWLLLLLRALAVCLLALAFARPFFRQSEQQSLGTDTGRALVVLIDTSASMQRDQLWQEATAQLQQLLEDDVSPADRLAVLAFDDKLQTICGFDQWTSLDPAQRSDAVMSSLEDVAVSWRATNLAAGLIEAAERLDALSAEGEVQQERTVVVISDLQSGSDLQLLQSYDWPKGIAVELRPVGDRLSANNAGLHPVAESHVALAGQEQQLRMHVVNAQGADRDEFQIRWVDEFDRTTSDSRSARSDTNAVSVIVPAGQSRIVRAAARPQSPDIGQLILTGDDHEFDNTCYVPPPRPRSARVALLGAGDGSDPQGMEFYLPAALPSLPQRTIELVQWQDLGDADESPQLVVVTGPPTETDALALREYAVSGGTILLAAGTVETLASVFSLLEVAPTPINEADDDDYAMLTNIDYSHALFAALDDPRFSDFTKVRFWKHRRLPDDAIPEAHVLARFDNGDAAVLATPLGKGRLIVLTSGWHPQDSQLAVSTKFVPMLNGLVDDVAGIVERRTTYYVGETVSLGEFDLAPSDVDAVLLPDGQRVRLAEDATSFAGTDSPGIYRFVLVGGGESDEVPPSFAVNIAPAESRTSRMTDETLSGVGVALSSAAAVHVIDAAADRQLRAGELENRQKLWRWVVVAVIVLLILETLLASRAARQQLSSV